MLPDFEVAPPILRSNRKIDLLKAYQLRVVNKLTYEQIAKQFGVTKSAVIQALQSLNQHLPAPEQVDALASVRVPILTGLEQTLMASLADPAKIAKASLNNVAYAFTQVHIARRLEEGKSTENRSILTTMMNQAYDTLHIDKAPATPTEKPLDVQE